MKKPADSSAKPVDPVRERRKKTIVAIICLLSIIAFFTIFAIPMGLSNAINTLMKTAFDLLLNTVFYIMALAVIAGALSELMSEFGVVDLINRILSPLMKPLFGMPGASALGIVTTYLSDNPAILTLASDNKFRRFFKAYQVPALTNLGTSFGMGLIVTSFMLAFSKQLGNGVIWAALCGNLGTVVGAIVSTRLMLVFMKRQFDKDEPAVFEPEVENNDGRAEKPRGVLHVLNALMDGGKKGVDLGLAVIPGVLIICSVVMMLTKGAPAGGYSGEAYEGIGALPWLADKINFLLKPLFGFASSEALGVPVTALGSAGAALPMIREIVLDSASSGIAAKAIL
ncbi:MAG: hypothetical protein IJK54_06495, partial [Clostridia bacterium]|nr:hypothetical protein [Clostridia bacterium]